MSSARSPTALSSPSSSARGSSGRGGGPPRRRRLRRATRLRTDVSIRRSGVGVMARAPSAAGKTRLESHLPPFRLAALRAALLADTLDLVRAAADANIAEGVIFFTPAGAAIEIAAAADGRFPCVCQSDGDLGQRMRSALEELLGPRGCGTAML